MNTPLRDGKGTLYEGGTRVPLMWSWAGKIATGSTSEAVVGPIDLYPTVIDLLRIPKPGEQVFDGISYAKVLKGEGSLERKAYFNYHPHAGANRAGGVWVRSGDFKLLRWFGQPNTFELYNLGEDIGEAKDLSVKMPEKVKELDALIDQFLLDTGALYPRPNPDYQPPSAAAQPSDPLQGWKERQCKASVAEGILTLKATGKPGTAFLGHAMGKLVGPARVTFRVRSSTGGSGKIDHFPRGSADPEIMFSAPFEIKAGDWQEITVELKESGPLGTMRVYLPDSEMDFIQVAPAHGKAQRSDF
jgi:hypothetical protein